MHRVIAALMAAASCAGYAQAQTITEVTAGPPFTLEQALAATDARGGAMLAATRNV